MMQQIRDGLKGPVIIGLLLLIVGIPFAFSGIQGYLQSGADPVVAKVGDAKITQAQLRNAYDQRYRQLQQLYGENFRADSINPVSLRESVLKDLVQELLMRQYARKTGYRAADAALRDYLVVVPAFQENGKFSKQRYLELLARSGQTPESFEAQQRDALVVEQLREVVLGSSFITPAQAAEATKLAQQQRGFSYIAFDPAKYMAGIDVTDEQVAKRYEEKKATYQAPERIKLSYVELALDNLVKAEPPAQDVLKTLYESEKSARFSTPETRRASHILIGFGADKAAAKAKAEDVYKQLKAGADFSALAKANSDDPGSKQKGGDLGVVKRGDSIFPAKFEAALFGLEKGGEFTEPVETEFGWHIIRLDQLNAARTMQFEEPEVQKALVDLYQQTEAQKHFQELSSRLEELAFDNDKTLEPVAKELDLKVQRTDWFMRSGGEGITANAAVLAAAFSPEVRENDENSKPIAIDAQHVVVIRKAEYEAPRQRTQQEVEPAIREALKKEQALAGAQAAADAAVAALQGGQTLDAVAKSAGVTVQSPAPTGRSNNALSRALLSAVFKLPRPAADKLTFGEAKLEQGEIAVVALSVVSDGAVAGSANNDPQGDIGRIRDVRAGSEFAAYRAGLEKRIPVDVKALPQEEAPLP
jgi:peptidyl-prolyl cis-trans isomerase D